MDEHPMETFNQFVDLQLEIENFLSGFGKKLNAAVNDHCAPKKETNNHLSSPSPQDLRENYLSSADFEFELNLFSRSFVSNVCREAELNGQLLGFGFRHAGEWYIKPIAFLEYIEGRNKRFSAKVRRFLQNPRSIATINEIFERRK
jgi:hypothetical protein